MISSHLSDISYAKTVGYKRFPQFRLAVGEHALRAEATHSFFVEIAHNLREKMGFIRLEISYAKKLKLQYPTVTARLHAEIDEKITISFEVKKFS